MDAKTFYMLVVLLLCCCERDSLTKQKARTRWMRVRNAAFLSIPGGFFGMLAGFSRVESIKQRLLLFVTWNPDAVGLNTLRWLLGQTVAGEDAPFDGTHVFHADAAEDARRGMAAVCHADAGAADQIVKTVLFDEAGQPRPQQGDHRAVAVVGMHRGASHFHRPLEKMGKPGEVELGLGIEAARIPCPLGREEPIGSHHLQGLVVTHQEVMAEGIEQILVQAGRGMGQACAHLPGEHLVAQTLRFPHLLR